MTQSSGKHTSTARRTHAKEAGEFAGIGAKNYRRNDHLIHEDVNRALTDDGALDCGDIEISVSEGTVILAGTVPTLEQKKHAQQLSERCDGVRAVRNELRVAQ